MSFSEDRTEGENPYHRGLRCGRCVFRVYSAAGPAASWCRCGYRDSTPDEGWIWTERSSD